MTAQSGEILLYKGEEFRMAAEPLYPYLEKQKDIKFEAPNTACWRGYYGTWTIRHKRLHLLSLKAYIQDFNEVGLEYLFPGRESVFATWFTGVIRIPIGEILEYVHMGYETVFEKDIFLKIEKGLLVEEREVDNREAFEKRKKERGY